MFQSHKNSYKIKVTQKNGQNNECRDEREKERNEMQSESFILIVHAFWASGGNLIFPYRCDIMDKRIDFNSLFIA